MNVEPAHLLMYHTTRRSHVSGGFTLIELIAIMLLVAIAAGIAAPTLNSLQSTRTAMAARQILKDMSYARQAAMARGLTHWVVFSTGSGTWSVLADDRDTPGRAGATVVLDMATSQPYTATLGSGEYAGVAFAACNFSGATEVGFDWRGRPVQADGSPLPAQGSVTLSDGKMVVVEADTGYIRYVP